MSYLLRHGAVKERISISPQGYVSVSDILERIEFRDCTVDDIHRVVEENEKKRFTLSNIDGVLVIKANQGHSLSRVDDLSLRTIDKPEYEIIHGTYFKYWESIKAKGLSRMSRTHIHFSKGRNFICGLRRNAEIFLTIDFEKAKADGIKFYESENGVVLCPGNSEGYLETKYFLKAVTANGTKLII